MGDKPDESQDRQVEIWKVKKLIKNLQAARGNGTSMISLIIPPKDQVSRIEREQINQGSAHDKMDEKLDHMYEILLEYISRSN